MSDSYTSGVQHDEIPLWEVFDLAPVDQRNADPETERVPTPDGKVRCYFDDELMYSIGGKAVQFSVSMDNEPGQPAGFVFDAPAAMFEGNEISGPALWTLMTEEQIPISEKREPSPHRRTWVPGPGVSWDFEITMETEPYEVPDDVE